MSSQGIENKFLDIRSLDERPQNIMAHSRKDINSNTPCLNVIASVSHRPLEEYFVLFENPSRKMATVIVQVL